MGVKAPSFSKVTYKAKKGFTMQVFGYSFNITDALINKLEELFPDKIPTERTSSEELAYLQGQQSVISKIKDLQIEEKD